MANELVDYSQSVFFWAEEPLHFGEGATPGGIDNPHQRERHTRFPKNNHGGVKGMLRAHCRDLWQADESAQSPARDRLWAVFGPDAASASANAGALSPVQMRLLLFPVPSLNGLFAWVTCPSVLSRLAIAFAQIQAIPGVPSPPPAPPASPASGEAGVTARCPLRASDDPDAALVLDQDDFTPVPFVAPAAAGAGAEPHNYAETVARWICSHALPAHPAYDYLRFRLLSAEGASHIAILNDDDFRDFTLHCTEVVSRIRIQPDTGVVADTGLWNEENLPPDTLLFSMLHASGARLNRNAELKTGAAVCAAVRDALTTRPIIQGGGDQSVGLGYMRAMCPPPAAATQAQGRQQ